MALEVQFQSNQWWIIPQENVRIGPFGSKEKAIKACSSIERDVEPQRCGGCRFWRNIGVGECRFDPPKLFVFENAADETKWPPVTESELGCGKWEAKP